MAQAFGRACPRSRLGDRPQSRDPWNQAALELASAWTSAAVRRLPPIAQSPCSNSSTRTQVTPRMWAERTARSLRARVFIELIAAAAHGLNGDIDRARDWTAAALAFGRFL